MKALRSSALAIAWSVVIWTAGGASFAPAQSPAGGFFGYNLGSYNPLPETVKGVGWSESFETDGVSWRPLYQEGGVEVAQHTRTAENRREGERSEQITLRFRNSGFAFLGHYVDYPILFNEAAPSLWVCADRPGVTLGVLVTLPKTIRPDTNAPLTLLLSGSTYTQTDRWERLAFPSDLRSELDRTVQAIRGEHQLAVNSEEAYIRQVVLFVESKSGGLNLYVDDLRVSEHVPCPMDLLRQSELSAAFDPINLLAFRFKVTASTVVVESAVSAARDWPDEPFGVNGAKIVGSRSPLDGVGDSVFERAGPVGFESDGASEDGRINTAEYFDRSDDYQTSVISGSGTRPVSDIGPESFPGESNQAFPDVKFQERLLTFGGTMPVAVRAIEYQGEPLAFLKSLQFNAVWLKTTPTRELLDEARQADLWLIAPPPVGRETVTDSPTAATQAPADLAAGILPYFNRLPVGTPYDPVLLWDLGAEHKAEDAAAVKSAATTVRGLDPHMRPIVCHARNGLNAYTYDNGIDLLLLKRRPQLTSLDMLDYGRWLREYPNLATPYFPFWNEIQTEPDPQMLAQCRFFGAVGELPAIISYEQIRQQVRQSLAAEMHGLLFSSNTPLTGTDHETQYRVCALELINLELILIDSWFASGRAEEIIESESESISAAILRTEKTSLLLPLSAETGNQLVFGQAAANDRSFVVPVRDGYSADLLLPGNLRKVPSHRRAGGVRLDLDEISMNSLVFLAQSDWYTRVIAEKSPRLGRRMAELAIRQAKMRLDIFRQTLSELQQMHDRGKIPNFGRSPLLTLPEQTTVLQQTCSAIALAEEYLQQDDPPQAYLQAERAMREIRMNERRFWQTATRNDLCQPLLPVSTTFATLPAYIEYYDRLNTKKLTLQGHSLLVGGDMEKTEEWTAARWMRFETPFKGVATGLRREPAAARTGNYGLCFAVTPDGFRPLEMETTPLWVEVPIPVKTGDLICVQGWIKIPNKIENGVDGFMIYDNHGGPALAQRYVEATDWQPFTFYRYAAFDGEMKLNFSLSGFGEVWLDDITAHVVR